MRIFAPAVLALALMFTPAHAGECQKTLSDLLRNAENLNPVLFQAKPDALKILVAKVNKNRAADSKEPIEADTFVVGHFKSGGVPQVGIALSYKGCVVPGTSFVIDPPMLVRILLEAGLDADALEPFKGGIDS